MTDTVRYIDQTDRINALYQRHDTLGHHNVFALNPLLCPRVLGMLDDVQALLEDPQTRPIAERILRDTLKTIAESIINRSE